MLVIESVRADDVLRLALDGRLDAAGAPQLEAALDGALDGVAELHLDFAKVGYISSAGLRVVLTLQKQMDRQGTLTLWNVSEGVREIFEITGFLDILTIRS